MTHPDDRREAAWLTLQARAWETEAKLWREVYELASDIRALHKRVRWATMTPEERLLIALMNQAADLPKNKGKKS